MPSVIGNPGGFSGLLNQLLDQVQASVQAAFQTVIPLVTSKNTTGALLGPVNIDPLTRAATGLGSQVGVAGTDGAGNWQLLGNPFRFEAQQTVASGPQSIPNSTSTAVAWDTTVLDPYSGFASGTYTVPAGGAGLWVLSCTLAYASNSTGVRSLAILVNGQSVVTDVVSAGVDAQGRCHGCILAPLTVGEAVTVNTFQSSGGPLALSLSGSTQPALLFTGCKLSN